MPLREATSSDEVVDEYKVSPVGKLVRPSLVILAHSCHPAVHRLTTVHELDCSLAEEEIHMIVVL